MQPCKRLQNHHETFSDMNCAALFATVLSYFVEVAVLFEPFCLVTLVVLLGVRLGGSALCTNEGSSLLAFAGCLEDWVRCVPQARLGQSEVPCCADRCSTLCLFYGAS